MLCEGRRHSHVKVLVRLVELLDLTVDKAVPTLLHGDLDGPQLGGRGAGCRQTAGGHLVNPAELEQHQYVVDADGTEEASPPAGDEHALVVRDEQMAGFACGFSTMGDGLRVLLEVAPGWGRHLHP